MIILREDENGNLVTEETFKPGDTVSTGYLARRTGVDSATINHRACTNPHIHAQQTGSSRHTQTHLTIPDGVEALFNELAHPSNSRHKGTYPWAEGQITPRGNRVVQSPRTRNVFVFPPKKQ